MPKFDLSINGVTGDVAAPREAWGGELPPTGSYEGVLKILSVDVISQTGGSKYAGQPKLRVGVELRNTKDGKYDGYLAWGNLNLIDPGIPFVNQFLLALTDGSDAQFEKIKKAFYVAKPNTDERKKHILKIGAWNVNSPEGELPIKVSLTNKPFYNTKTQQTTDQVRVESYLVSELAVKRSGGSAAPAEEPIEEETSSVEVDADYDDDDDLLGDDDE